MAGTTDFLMTVQGMAKLHDDMIKMICGKYQLTLIEGKIISFCIIIREKIRQVILWNCENFPREMSLLQWRV